MLFFIAHGKYDVKTNTDRYELLELDDNLLNNFTVDEIKALKGKRLSRTYEGKEVKSLISQGLVYNLCLRDGKIEATDTKIIYYPLFNCKSQILSRCTYVVLAELYCNNTVVAYLLANNMGEVELIRQEDVGHLSIRTDIVNGYVKLVTSRSAVIMPLSKRTRDYMRIEVRSKRSLCA